MVTPAGLKPTTLGTGILRSIQLNYGAFCSRGAKIRYFSTSSKSILRFAL